MARYVEPKFPEWLIHGIEKASITAEWYDFVKQLTASVQQHLLDNHVSKFSNLNDSERQLIIDEALVDIHGGSAYQSFCNKLASILDVTLSEKVERDLVRCDITKIKSDVIYDNLEEAALALLRKWPEFKRKAYVFLNQPCPWNLRRLLWKLNLANPTVLDVYRRMLDAYPEHAVSQYDAEISRKCEHLLTCEPTFIELRGSVGAYFAMKAVLGYYQTQMKKENDPLLDTEYLIILPLIYALHDKLPRREPADRRVVELLVEEFFVFMDRRHPLMLPDGIASTKQFPDSPITPKEFAAAVLRDMHKMDSDTTGQLLRTYFSDSANAREQADSLAEELAPYVKLLLRCFFVGFLSLDVILFLADHYILMMDSPEFQERFLQVTCAAMILLTWNPVAIAERQSGKDPNVIERDRQRRGVASNANVPPGQEAAQKEQRIQKLLDAHWQEPASDFDDDDVEASAPPTLVTAFYSEGPKVRVRDFQYLVNRHFYGELYLLLSRDIVTMHDPRVALRTRWSTWSSSALPHAVHPADREIDRVHHYEERERIKQLESALQLEHDQRSDVEAGSLEARRLHFNELQEVREDYESVLARLREDFAREREVSFTKEEHLRDEIARLEDEMEKLRAGLTVQPMAINIPDDTGREVAPAPPPSRQAEALLPEDNSESGETVFCTLLRYLMGGIQRAAHAGADEAETLNGETKKNLSSHAQDMKNAEMEVFGRFLAPHELEQMTPEEQQRYSQSLAEIVKQRLLQRYALLNAYFVPAPGL